MVAFSTILFYFPLNLFVYLFKYRLLPLASQLVFQDQRHYNTYYADHQSAEEGVPPNRVADRQPKAERLTDDTRQPEQESVDDQCEQTQCQYDKRTGE